MPTERAPIALPDGIIVSVAAASISCSAAEKVDKCVVSLSLLHAVIQKGRLIRLPEAIAIVFTACRRFKAEDYEPNIRKMQLSLQLHLLNSLD
jgi:hypothetical protein